MLKEPQLSQAVIHHELIHARVSRAFLDTGQNPGLYIKVISPTFGIPKINYMVYFRMDETLAHYKGGLAARALAKKHGRSKHKLDQRLAKRLRGEAFDQLSQARSFSKLSLKYLDRAEIALQKGQVFISDDFVDVSIGK